MGSCFYYLASFYHDELVGVLYRTEPVRDDNYRFPFIKFHQVLYNSPFVIGIQCIGRLVQKYIIRILVYGTRYQDSLFLSLAQSDTILPYLCVLF